jgi:DNA-binding NarL/FixJ family response regulator
MRVPLGIWSKHFSSSHFARSQLDHRRRNFMKSRVLLADDYRVVREGLRVLLEQSGFNVVGEAADGREAVERAAQLEPDIVVLDLSMPALNGIEAAREILRLLPHTRAIILTVHRDEQYVQQAFQAGARGYVLKTRATTDLISAINNVSEGKIYLSPDIPQNVIQPYLGAEGAAGN